MPITNIYLREKAGVAIDSDSNVEKGTFALLGRKVFMPDLHGPEGSEGNRSACVNALFPD